MAKLTCNRRMQELGPWKRKKNLDYWRSGDDRWKEEGSWPEGFPKPRVCSFCSGIHPDDAIRLISMGWESDYAKSYKRYLNPPEGVKSPSPPVKLYIQHLNTNHINKFNKALAANLKDSD